MTPQIYAGLPPIDRKTFINTIKHPILNAICDYTGHNVEHIKSASRVNPLVECRVLISHFLRKRTRLTLKQIALEIGRSDHTSVIHLLKLYEDRYKLEKAFRTKADELANIIDNDDNIDYH